MDFNAPWDEPDNLWSTPTPNSPPRLPSQLHLDTSLDPPEPGPSSPLHQSPTSEFSDTPTISNAFKSAHIPHTYTISHPTPTDSSASSRLPPLSLHLPDDDLQTTGTPALDSSPISPSIVFSSPSSTQSMFSASSVANSPSNLPPDDDDDFGDFDDGDLNQNGQLSADDGFGDFGTFASAPVTPLASPRLVSRPIVPFKLPSSINPDTLRLALAPALEALFDSSTDPSPWLSSNLTPQKPTRNSSQKSISKTHLPPIHYQSEVLRQAWTSLVEDDNGLGVPLDWKRSQIRRQFLVHLGIPVDLNDFLTPSPLSRQHLTIQTRSNSSNYLHPHAALGQGGSPRSQPSRSASLGSSSVPHTPEFNVDRQRCTYLVAIPEDELRKSSLDELTKMRDELLSMTASVSELLAHKLQVRDTLSQDSESYNTMISDLINAAQKIKMNSPNVAKRASSIQLGSSSIATPGSGRWRTFGSGSKPTTPIGSATSGTSPNSSAKRFSVL